MENWAFSFRNVWNICPESDFPLSASLFHPFVSSPIQDILNPPPPSQKRKYVRNIFQLKSEINHLIWFHSSRNFSHVPAFRIQDIFPKFCRFPFVSFYCEWDCDCVMVVPRAYCDMVMMIFRFSISKTRWVKISLNMYYFYNTLCKRVFPHFPFPISTYTHTGFKFSHSVFLFRFFYFYIFISISFFSIADFSITLNNNPRETMKASRRNTPLAIFHLPVIWGMTLEGKYRFVAMTLFTINLIHM